MDFSLTETQEELAGLARKILSDRMTTAHLKAVERTDTGYDADTWRELGAANLLGVGVPEAHGGLGLGFLDLCMVLREVGRHVAPLPAIATLASAALPIASFGTDAQRAVLADVVSGDAVLTAALQEHTAEPESPTTRATREGDGWRIDGVKTAVPYAHVARLMLVPAATDAGVALFLVAPSATGVTLDRQEGQSAEPIFLVTLDGVRVGSDALLGGDAADGAAALRFTLDRTMVAMCAVVSGTSAEAVRITAAYSAERKQFGHPIGEFQAVHTRMADAYIDSQAIELTMLQAATHLDEGRDVPDEVLTAKFWAADGGHRVGHACLHVHGGISIDLDYPIHRYFLWLKQAEFTLGAATPQLVRLGRHLADTPA
ncbi:MAG TPA: acyl-CoA dehydrogenase family protein [Acidimicrobiia bacterium]|nr:acyl-CoA dehydrogenase family protein [Acidimicrobiia bacterium]